MPRAAFTLELRVDDPPEVVWPRLWDLDRHTAAVPLTTTRGTGALALGSRFSARTALGPLGFDDDMVVTSWSPPLAARIEKVGRVLRGGVEVDLEPTPGGGTLVRWRQRYGATGVPEVVAALARPVVRTGYLLALRRITAA